MKDKVFIDTNILIYFVSDDEVKKKIAKSILLKENINIISSQVINEFVSITRKKKILSPEDILSFDIYSRYKFSSWDSLIIASAIENDCRILYSEDMQHNLLIDKKLRNVNPFI